MTEALAADQSPEAVLGEPFGPTPGEDQMDRAPVVETKLSVVFAAFGSGQACLHHMPATA